MNCPNCNKKPVGLFPSFRLYRLGFRKAFKGYLKCKHCDTLLKEESRSDFSKYRKPYWYFFGVYVFLLLGSLFLLFYLLSTDYFSGLYIMFGFMLFLVGLLGVMDSYIKPRYWVIIEVEESAPEEHSPMRLTPKGWAVFSIYSIAAVALFILTPQLLEGYQLSEQYILGGTFLYSVVVVGGALFILTRFSIRESKTAGDS